MRASTIVQLAALAQLGSAHRHGIYHRQSSNGSYTLTDDYPTGMDFFSKFDFFTDSDPTHGTVTYVDQETAANAGLISSNGDSTYIGVDNTNTVSDGGRQSVRLTSQATYNGGLFVLDLAHMPGSVCGSWPAFWTVGPDWPNNGEIDIIEGVNQQNANAMTLHTNSGCSINSGGFTGTISTSNCDVNAPGQPNNAGCGIDSTDTTSYGDGFNANGGGIYVMEWTDQFIQVFFFSHDNAPSDLTSGSPNPAGWGQPAALFQGGCDIPSHFKNNQIVFDITFCGDWAGAVWGSGSCSSQASSCEDFVKNNPSAFQDTYWQVNSLKVYTRN